MRGHREVTPLKSLNCSCNPLFTTKTEMCNATYTWFRDKALVTAEKVVVGVVSAVDYNS